MSRHFAPAKNKIAPGNSNEYLYTLYRCLSFLLRIYHFVEASLFNHGDFKQAFLGHNMAPSNLRNRTYPLSNARNDRIRDDMASGISWRLLGVISLPINLLPALTIK